MPENFAVKSNKSNTENADELVQREKRLELFLSTLAHDLKNILQAQIRSLELLNKGAFGEVSDAQKEMLEITLESANFMKMLLYSITKTCLGNSGVITLERNEVDIKHLLKTCITESKILGQGRKVCINFDCTQQNEILICADGLQLRRVFENLLNNVITYAYPNTTVKVVVCVENGRILVSFENRSKEISSELGAQIFEKYVSSRKNGFNVGLGLYFCKKLVLAHGGKIYLEADGERNRFVVELPIMVESGMCLEEVVL